ncbi:rheb small monomeric GTPase RhbA [Piedraia hortae CBS 480.64]|uniref:Rheb small monomeric GTPase RhbA n=1 Tax=Piedraia hortae CBS 480.64 TaxID=1314780 RepID=A0A6A7BTW8_9PEZI|nr:rheb small monomeric GTPase RhbA [Piedraia hortae CBS 480.64]
MANPLRQRKVAVVGSRSVGKSSLTVQFVEGHFVDTYYPTIENTFAKSVDYNDEDYALEIVDTAGQDEYSMLNSKHFIGIHGYMIVYSVASQHSFDMVRILRDKILNHLGADTVPIMMVGNKSDLSEVHRQISPTKGRELAKELGCGFIEASARYNRNVTQAFRGIVAEIEHGSSRREVPNPGAEKCSVM